MTDFAVGVKFTGDDKLSQVMGRMGAKATGFSATLDMVGKKLASAKQDIATLVKPVGVAGLAIGTAAAFVGKSIYDAGANFEEAISAVGAVGLQTREQIRPLEKEALRLGQTTKFTATEAANAMETMARAGFSNQEILSGVGGVLDAAAASGLEMAEVADHVSNALKGMGLQSSDATRVADVLTLASSKTNSSIGSLGESLKNVASTARQFNIPLEDTVAAVALLQDVGLDASVAGSAMNTMLTKMAAPTADIAAKMKQFGVTFEDAQGNMLPFQDVLANISKAAKASGGNMDQVAFLADLVGLRGQKAAANLKDLFDSGKVQTLTDALYGAEGAAKKMALLRMDNLKGDVTLLESAIDGVKVSIFDLNKGPMRDVVQGVTAWVNANKELITSKMGTFIQDLITSLPQIYAWTKRLAIAFAVFKGMEMAVAAARLSVMAYNGTVMAGVLATKGWAVAVALFTGKIEMAKMATMAFNAVAAVNPMFWVGAAIVGLIALAIYWDEATEAATRYGQSVLDIWTEKFGDDEDKKVLAARKKGLILEKEDTSGIDRAKEKQKSDKAMEEFKAKFGNITKQVDASLTGMDPETAAPKEKPVFGLSAAFNQGQLATQIPRTATREEITKSETKESVEITVKAEGGTTEITKQPKPGAATSVKLQKSGTL